MTTEEKKEQEAELFYYQRFIGEFLQNECVIKNNQQIPASDLYNYFAAYFEKINGCSCINTPGCIITKTAFGRELTRRGIFKKHTMAGSVYIGITTTDNEVIITDNENIIINNEKKKKGDKMEKIGSLSNYRAQCVIGQFIQAECENTHWVRTAARVLYTRFISYFEKIYKCDCPISETFLGRDLTRRGIMPERYANGIYRVGIALKSNQDGGSNE